MFKRGDVMVTEHIPTGAIALGPSPYHLEAYGPLKVVSAGQPSNSGLSSALRVDAVAALRCCTDLALDRFCVRECYRPYLLSYPASELR